jgi:filamentous hemagglutinin family protein
MNRIFRVVFNQALGTWVAVAETARGRGKRSVRSSARMASRLAMLGGLGGAFAAAATPPTTVLAPTELPTGGAVTAGTANIHAATAGAGAAVLNIDQLTQRAVINWNTFNVGSAAQVNFNQPNSSAATLNRVLDSNPSQIAGRITAPGQVFLSNPNGVTFGKTASVDVGALTATTHGIADADFMAGLLTFARNGATGAVVNEGELRAAVGGYIALLAPEVRNQGVVIARLGTVVMAAGEAFTLNFDGQRTLAGITVRPATIQALVENKGAVLAPGGLIVLSARALDRLQGGVVKNSGRLEATGLATQGGRIVLEASDRIANSGSISANSGADGSPAGSVTLAAPVIDNSGAISASGLGSGTTMAAALQSGGSITLTGGTITQERSGALDVSGASGGQLLLQAGHDIALAGNIVATAEAGDVRTTTSGTGGSVVLQAGRDVTLDSAVIDASGAAGGGRIRIEGGGAQPAVTVAPQAPDAPQAPSPAPTLALLGNTQLRSSSRRGNGGSVVLTADRVGLFDTTAIDASGATGGGQVFVGGGFQGQDPAIANASQTVVATSASIDASATVRGDGGKVVVWSEGHTGYGGSIQVHGGVQAGNGGAVEVSGKGNLDFRGSVDASAAHGKGGSLLLDPKNITVDSNGLAVATDVDQFADTPSTDSTIAPSVITTLTHAGTAVTLQANNDIAINSSILTVNPSGTGGALTFTAGRSITVNASVSSDSGNVTFNLNNAGADGNRAAGTAAFVNNSQIDAGTGNVAITMGAAGVSGSISTGHVIANNLSITHNGATAGAVSGQIDLGQTEIAGDLTVTASAARNLVNTGGTLTVYGTAAIDVGSGDVTLTGGTTNLNIVALTRAGNVTLVNASAMQLGASSISGNLVTTTRGALGSTGAVVVAGTTNLTANSGGFGSGDPFIALSNAGNHFAGGITVAVTGLGYGGTGGSATILDSGALNVASAIVALDLNLTAGGAINLALATAARDLALTAGGAITQTGVVTAPRQTVLTAGSANNITLDNASNQFGSVQIVSGKNVTLVDSTPDGFAFGYRANDVYTPSHVYGNLVVTAAGDISQTQYGSANVAPITVDGAATFNTTKLNTPVNLYLGPTDPFDGNTPGSANSFAGTVTLARSNGSGYTNVQLRNTSTAAGVLSGLGSVGALNNVYLKYDNVPSLSLPGMTLTGSLKVLAPSVLGTAGTPGNIISQTGDITVAQNTMVQAGTTGDIVLTNAGNNFNVFGIVNTGGRNVSVTDANAIVLYAPGYNQAVTGNYTVAAPGITGGGNNLTVPGTLTLNAGSGNILLQQYNVLNILAIPAANNVAMYTSNGLVFDNATIAGTLTLSTYNGGSVITQLGGTAVNMTGNGVASFNTYGGGVTLANVGNVLGPIAFSNVGAVNIRENDAITQASAWSNGNAITLTTSNDQAITMTQAGNYFGNLTVTQINSGAGSAGAVFIRETADGNGMTQGSAWTLHGTTTLDSGSTSITLNNANNVFGPLQVIGATGNTNGVASSVTLYAKNVGSNPAITDVGSTGAWATGTGVVKLVAYNSTGATAGGGDINLANTANVMGDLYIKANTVTLTEADNITDGAPSSWTLAGDFGWVTTGTTSLIVANPTGRSITLDNINNQLGSLLLATTGSAGNLASVLITDNTALTQAAAWVLGTTPVTLDARNNAITLNSSGNVLGGIAITTANGTPTALTLSEDDAITQASAWVLPSVPVTLTAENGKAITLTSATNVFGNLTITGGTVSITENADIKQGGDWTTTGTTTLNPTANAIALNNAGNVLGDLAIAGTPTAVSIRENHDITQASAWVQTTTPFVLNAGSHDIVLTQASNQLGDLTLTAQNASVTENRAAGISDGGAWTVPGTTTLIAGSANPIVLNANPASNFGAVSIVSASNADIGDVDGIVFAASTVAGTLTVTAGGAITQSGAISAPSLRLIGTGSATLNSTSNVVNNLAAGFTGGNLAFTNRDNFAVAVIGGTSGITIGGSAVALTSATGTVSGLSNVNPLTGSLAVITGTTLVLPQLTIAGAQTYTGSTVSGSGITLAAGLTSTATGAINFNSPVTLAANLTVQTANSPVNFNSTLAGGSKQLTVNAGSGTVAFGAAVSGMGATSDAGVALQVSSGGANFVSTLAANNGLAITGPVTFNDNVTLADGSASSVFAGLVTFNKAGGLTLSGYDGMAFNNGALLQSAATINTNNAALVFQTANVTGPFDLSLNSGTQTISGLNRMGPTLTSLTVTALNPATPGSGIAIAGPQTYNASSGSSITVGGNVSSTAAGAITFNSPVIVGASATVASANSAIAFAGTVNGNSDLTVNSGTAAKTFSGAVGAVTALGDGTGAALILQGTGTATFSDTVAARSGITAASPVVFNKNVSLGDGDTGSVFSALVTSGGGSGNSISGFDGMAFNGGLALTGGAVSVASNGSTINFGGAVSGAQNLTLNALAGGAGTVTGLDQIGATSTLTRLTVTGQTLSLPATGLAVAGPMSFTAAGGITLNGAVGSSSAPATAQVDFNGPVTLAGGAISVTAGNAAVNFNGTVNGAQALTVNAGTGTTTFGAAVGATTALTSITTDAGGTTAINGGSVRSSGAQTYNDAVTLGATSTLTGTNVSFNGSLNGAFGLSVNDSGITTFGGIVGGSTPLANITTDAAGTVAINTTAITTSGAQTYNGYVDPINHAHQILLGADTTLTGVGLTFNAEINGTYSLVANARSGALVFNNRNGDGPALTSLVASGNTIFVIDFLTSGAQSYTAPGGITLSGNMNTMGGAVSFTGPITLADFAGVYSSGGNITLVGATTTVNSGPLLTLHADAGNIVLGGAVGGISRPGGIDLEGNDITMAAVAVSGGQDYLARNNITLTQSRTSGTAVTYTADTDHDGVGSFVLLTGVALATTNQALTIDAADIDLQGTSTVSTGSGKLTLNTANNRNIALGGSDAGGQLTLSGSELSRISGSGGLDLVTTGSGWIHVNGITAPQSQGLTGTLGLLAQGTGEVAFTAASAFNAVTANATGGLTNVAANLSTSNDPIVFATPTVVAAAATINSGGGSIAFQSTLAVNNALTLGTGNGALSFGGAVGGNQALTLNLGGGSVGGLGQLQNTLTGLTVNSTSGITLPAFAINGPEVFNTGSVTVAGNQAGVGITYNNNVNIVPASGSALTLNAGTGTLAFNSPAAFNANTVTLKADDLSFVARPSPAPAAWCCSRRRPAAACCSTAAHPRPSIWSKRWTSRSKAAPPGTWAAPR